MSIRLLAEKDLATVLEDAKFGFGWAITLTDPSGHSDESLVGQSNDISQVIDPETGQLVSGRAAHVTLRISSLTAAGFSDLPRSVSGNSLPWVVKFQDINGNDHTFRVRQSDPDRALGVVRLTLEAYAQ